MNDLSDLPSAEDQIAKIAAGLEALHERLMQGGARGLYKIASIIMTDSQDNYAPVKAGVLRASGHVDEPVIEDGDAYVVLGYGGAAEAYALVQHEDLTFHHAIGQAKYLERPLLLHSVEIAATIADEMRGAMFGGAE